MRYQLLAFRFLRYGAWGEPLVLKGLLSSDSFQRVHLEEFLDEILGLRRNVLPLTIIESILTLHILIENLFWCVSFKQWTSC